MLNKNEKETTDRRLGYKATAQLPNATAIQTESKNVNTAIQTLQEPDRVHTITDSYQHGLENPEDERSIPIGGGNTVIVVPMPFTDESLNVVAREQMAHEFKHSYDEHIGKQDYIIGSRHYKRQDHQYGADAKGENGIDAWEVEAVQLGNEIRDANCLPNKGGYGGVKIQSGDQNVNTTTLSDNK